MVSFILKYVFRLIHVGLYGVLFATSILELSNVEFKPPKGFVFVPIIFGIAGVINMIILYKDNNYAKNSEYNKWKYMVYFKILLLGLMTPLLDKFLSAFSYDKAQIATARFGIFLLALIISPYTRFYREKYCIKETTPLKSE